MSASRSQPDTGPDDAALRARFDAELLAAGLVLSDDDRVRLFPTWADHLPTRDSLRAAAPALPEEPSLIEKPSQPGGWRLGCQPERRCQMSPVAHGSLPGIPASIDICDLDLKGVSDAIRTKAISSVEATEAYLQRIEQHDGVLQSYITITADLARAQARRADAELAQGHTRGPLHGVPIGLKDLISVAGVRSLAARRCWHTTSPPKTRRSPRSWSRLAPSSSASSACTSSPSAAPPPMVPSPMAPSRPAATPGTSPASRPGRRPVGRGGGSRPVCRHPRF